jgi:D-mannonate dehydratase
MAEEKAPRETKADTDKVFEELKVTGDNLLKTVRELIHQGNYRRIIIRNDHGHTLLEVPLTIGLVGALLMPVWAAIGAMAAMATGFTIIVERPGEEPKKPA